jgi:hypothetical protein
VEANRVASALEGIAEACGEEVQQRALRFGAGGPGPQRQALMRVRELADVFARNPDWIYQGDTLREVVALADARLRECGLARVVRGPPPLDGHQLALRFIHA